MPVSPATDRFVIRTVRKRGAELNSKSSGTGGDRSRPLVVYKDPGGLGYHPVAHMVRLAAELLGAELAVLDARPPDRAQKLRALLPRRRSTQPCLVVCRSAEELHSLSEIDGWRRRFGRVVVWIFDSFATEKAPRYARAARHFDQVFVTELEAIDWWRRVLGPVDWLPWGSDVFRLGSANPVRSLDLVRVGRQPPLWDDDAVSATACAARGLRFKGRPKGFDDPTDNERSLMQTFADAKFTLSFSNLVSPTSYTHGKITYLTARWTDAVSSGATVAGIPPDSQTARQLLWPEALLELGTVDREKGLDVITEAARQWTPARASHNWRQALERLDWRWRLERIRQALDVPAPTLEAELAELRARLREAAPR
jgi:hypothetical protein